MAPTPSELQSIRRSVDQWRRISDRLFQLGPLKVGLDGVLTWIPGVGDAYGLGASAFLLGQAARAGASQRCITRMATILGVDAVVGAVPLAGDLFDFVFRAHARAADVLKAEIDRIHAASLPAVQPSAPPKRSPKPAAPTPDRNGGREENEQEQARRVEELRAQYRDRGGGIDGRRR